MGTGIQVESLLAERRVLKSPGAGRVSLIQCPLGKINGEIRNTRVITNFTILYRYIFISQWYISYSCTLFISVISSFCL